MGGMYDPRRSEELGPVSSIFHFRLAGASARSALESMQLICTGRHQSEA